MNIKSLLLGSAAALVAVSGARAADAVVVAEPEPVEYVRVCDVYGAGFFYIPGTETCLKIGGYMRYEIGAGSLPDTDYLDTASGQGVFYNSGIPNALDKRHPFNDDGSVNTNDAWYKRARFQLRVDARSETELGTLRAYVAYNMQMSTTTQAGTALNPFTGDVEVVGNETTNVFDSSIEHAYIELGGFRAGKTDSYFSTFTDYAAGVIHDDLIPYGPFDTNQLSYTYDAGNGFTAGVALEEGFGRGTVVGLRDNDADGILDRQVIYSGDLFTLDSYAPNVVAGVGYTAGWGGIKVVGAYDAVWEEFSVKGRIDAKFNDMFSAFIMAGWADKKDEALDTNGDGINDTFYTQPNYYGGWGGEWGIWGGLAAVVSPKATINVQVSYDDAEDFAVAANVAYELVPGFTITPEINYADNFAGDDINGNLDSNDNNWAGFLRLQRNF